MDNICERPKCKKRTTEDLLYCSDACYDLDNDPVPIRVIARNKVNGFGNALHTGIIDAVVLPK